MIENKSIFATEVLDIENKILGDNYSFSESDLVAISLWLPKANYQTPLFLTSKGNFTVPTTMAECIDGLPSFSNLDNCLVNIKAVDQVIPIVNDRKEPVGGNVTFKQQSLTTSINLINLMHWEEIRFKALNAPSEDRYVIASKILSYTKQKKGFMQPILDSSELIAIKDIAFFEMWFAKANYYVPRFYANNNEYTVGLTFTASKESFPHLFPVSRSILVNLDKIVDFKHDRKGKLNIHFEGSDFTTPITNNKYKLLKKML